MVKTLTVEWRPYCPSNELPDPLDHAYEVLLFFRYQANELKTVEVDLSRGRADTFG